MFDGGRGPRRTDRYLRGLMAAGERHASAAPSAAETDPDVRFAAGALSIGLVRVHPSFRFEEALAGRLNAAALRLRAGATIETPVAAESPATISTFRARSAAGASAAAHAADPTEATAAGSWRRLPGMAGRQSRPLIVGGVGVASAAISIGAVYVAWRHSHSSNPMARAARAARGRASHAGRHGSGIVEEIIGVMS